ncbi:18276_t:CDS:2, partial [Racocetra persica]
VQEAVRYGANALMIYLGAPQNSNRRKLSELKIPEFHQALRENNIDINNVIVHAPYLLNLGNTTNEKIFNFSVAFLQKEMARMNEIGLKTIILHPGSALNSSPEKAIAQVTKGLNLVLQTNPNVRIALETMCQRSGEIGGTFAQLQAIIQQVDQPARVGVCWDTCHLYTAGYDIKNNLAGKIDATPEKETLTPAESNHEKERQAGEIKKINRA